MTWNEKQQAEMIPTDADFARAMALTAGLAEGNTDAIDYAMYESMTAGRTSQMMIAAAELLVAAHNLRDDQEAMSQWRIQIAIHRSRENSGERE